MLDLSFEGIITRAVVFLIAMVVHEFAHAYVAYLMGDPTAKEQGRMTLDPRANINVPGYIMGVIIGFGFLGSAPVNPYRMRDPRWGMFAAVLAGPVSNLILAAIFALPFALKVVPVSFFATSITGLPSPANVMYFMVFFNVLLFVFNMLPLSPLDGWTIVLAALPPNLAATWQRYQKESMYAFYGLIFLSFMPIGGLDILGILIWEPTITMTSFLMGGL